MAMGREEVSPQDFKTTKNDWIQHAKKNKIRLPQGSFTDFEWKDYCPAVFRNILELEKIEYADYMLSICGDETLREVSSPGRIGNVIFLSNDNRFVIKTLRKSQVKVLRDMLPKYYQHLKKYGSSLLTTLYGLHVVRPVGGTKVYFVGMSNVLQSDLHLHRRYDLKGSSRGRNFNKVIVHEEIIYKDIDLDFYFYLDPSLRNKILSQLKYDCEFLEAEGIMDYSLFLGVHIDASSCQDSLDRRNSVSGTRTTRHESPEFTVAGILKHNGRLGAKLPANAVRTPRNEMGIVSSPSRVRVPECYNVLLYFGVIDIFQNYNVIKRLEHAYKSIQYDSKTISAVNPKVYSSRFQDFLSKVFLAREST
ncbi:phosphatidylinositol 4-phosphate 5-kinase 10-like isoform X1 [Cucurbita moschata]|uniref:1-phosphatidylinositol-4-phosphate 5-kinase n=1 Tax=Cucurbita moschata TaxID=3662 RepID=A0A6J1FXY2_CUCMO|nr:phosphatidylinositol 4-phosphate 5-kinase 10-like isoform X1 [Cucurbita moschata]XP_022943554.1 phosphatidylinositol 4-phosphate 5-kinase 10-like isoform X1 [Cucurbita moschata]